MITYIFRKRGSGTFSIEKIFDALYARLERNGVALGRIELPRRTTGLLSVWRNMRYVARRPSSRFLHVTGDVHYAALLCLRAKTIVTVHDCVALQRGTGLKRWLMGLLWFSLPMRQAAAVTVISEQTKRELMQVCGVAEDKITIIPNFVDPAFTFSERPFASAAPRILHVGTSRNKNLPHVIAALRDIPCVLVIVGPIPATVREQLEQSGIAFENHVDVTHDAITRLYQEADIVSFPSTYEGFGMPILEAQATGRPVLTSDREPMRGVAGPRGAFLVDPQSTAAIREGFTRLLRDADLRAELVAAGRINCRGYSIDAVAARYAALYDGLQAS